MTADSDGEAFDAAWAARAFRAMEIVHVPGYFSAECREQYKALGLHPALAYFPVRSAAMGAVPAEVVEAVFYVFAPRLIRQIVPGCWDAVSPGTVLAARHEGVRRTLVRVLGDTLDTATDGGGLDEAVSLARNACEGLTAPGRPLYAAHAALPWPDDPLMQLWHASTLLREHRGDGHMAALLVAGLSPLESMLTFGLAGTGGVSMRFLRGSRGWSDAEWDEATESVIEQGLVRRVAADDEGAPGTGLALTAEGAALREQLEATTDLAAAAPWIHLGRQGTQRLAQLVHPLSKAVLASGVLAASRAVM